MNSRSARRPRGRRGFTLIELLVVISLIVFLAALTVVLGPALLSSEPSSRGAQVLQGSLFTAKQQALRDRNPYGIRLVVDPGGSGNINGIQYIQQPGDFTGGVVTVAAGGATFQNVDLSGGGLPVPTLWPVQPGDIFQCPLNTGTPYVITAVTANSITIPSNTQAVPATTSYRIMRAPRPVAGEDTIFLPNNVIIAPPNSGSPPSSILTPNVITAGGTTYTYYDILFSPSGAVIGPGAATGKIILWVYDTSQPWQTASQQTLITINTRTGLIAFFPVDTSGSGNYYSQTQNPAAAGGL